MPICKGALGTLALILMSFVAMVVANQPKQVGFVPGFAASFSQTDEQNVMAYYDCDRDDSIDIITKSVSQITQKAYINIYLWNKKRQQYLFAGRHQVSPTLYSLAISKGIDGFVTCQFYKQENNYKQGFTHFQCLNFQCKFDQMTYWLARLSAMDSTQPSLIEWLGQVGLLYSVNGQPTIFLKDQNHDISSTPLAEMTQSQQKIYTYTHSFSGDYSGDCKTDLVLSGPHPSNPDHSLLQFFIGNQGKLTLHSQVTIQDNIKHFMIEDINYDGKPDLIILTKSSYLYIHYHKYPGKICDCMQKDVYDLSLREGQISQIQKIWLGFALYEDAMLLFGDYNNDAYPDLSLTFIENDLPYVALLRNQACVDENCLSFNEAFTKQDAIHNIRTFKRDDFPSFPSTKMSFVDIGQDGKLDFIIERLAKPSLQPVYNNFDYDAFFVCVTIVNHHYYEIVVGGVIGVYVTLLNGMLAPLTASQLPQTGRALMLPYVRFGLGRTNNYLQYLTVTDGVGSDMWTPIVPNSDIIITSHGKQKWTLEVLIEPTQKMALVLLLVIVALLLVGIAILHLSRKQKEEDKENLESFYTLIG